MTFEEFCTKMHLEGQWREAMWHQLCIKHVPSAWKAAELTEEEYMQAYRDMVLESVSKATVRVQGVSVCIPKLDSRST